MNSRTLAKTIFVFAVSFTVFACASRPPQKNAYVVGCNHSNELPPLQLTPEQERLLSSVSPTPQTAFDYYMLLPKSYFKELPDTRERRVSYVSTKTLSKNYLTASHWFECDGGGFEVTIKLYRSASRTFILVKRDDFEMILEGGVSKSPSAKICRPTLWEYLNGAWIRKADESVPQISAKRVLKEYKKNPNPSPQRTSEALMIDYDVSPSRDSILVRGRWSISYIEYQFGRLDWNGSQFNFN